MKKFFSTLLLFTIVNFIALSQDDQNNIQFEESNVQIEKPPYFGLGGGYVGNFLFLNLDQVNELSKSQGLENIKSPLYLSGAQGFTAIGLIPNLRLGFAGYSGFNKVEKLDAYNTTKGLKCEVTYTAFGIDYGFVPFKSIAILPGLNFGWSKIILNNYKINQFSWDDLKSNTFTSNTVEGSFWIIQPNANVEFAATPFLMLRLGVGYPISFGPKWKLNDVLEVSNVPSNIKPSGLVLNFGIFVGLFNY